jgi:amino acid transporter
MALKRSIGLRSLTLIGMGGVFGSGWLFAPLLATQQAGPAALIAWGIGGVAIFLVALPFAEITGCIPEAGATARLPNYSHGSATSMIIGWAAWIGYATQAPIETLAIIKYIGPLLPDIFEPNAVGDTDHMTIYGYAIAAAILLLMAVINTLGVAWLDKTTAILTTIKILVPAVFVLTVISLDFKPSNFIAADGFAPYGAKGVLGAVSLGGVVFAYLGFRSVIDLAGEARRPHYTVPGALFLTILGCFLVYSLIQIAFIGGVPADALTNGWSKLSFDHNLGPLAGVAVVIGASWLTALLYGGAILGPFGSGLITSGSISRLGLALSRTGFFPSFFDTLSRQNVPWLALWLGFAAGLVMLFVPFGEMVAINSSAIVLSLCIGPIAAVALRHQLPDRRRPIRLPLLNVLGPVSFVIATFLVYWSGWNTIWRLDLGLLVGIVLFRTKLQFEPIDEPVNWPRAYWLVLYLAVVSVVSLLGNFGGGLGKIPLGLDMAILSIGAVVVFRLGLKEARPPERTQELVAASLQGP